VKTQPDGPILVVDPDEEFRTYVADLLENAGYPTVRLASGNAVLPAALAERPAAVLLEVDLPELSGYEVCRELRDRYSDDVPIIFVAGERTDALDRSAGLLVGADDYMVKPVDAGELIVRVRRLVDRPRLNEEVSSPNGRLASLTQREQEVLDLLTEGYRQEEIARKLVISPRTVATHIQRILVKLEVRSRAQAVAHAFRARQPA
jgi:DNA-binding NarL/FixJ family response regulator